MTKELNKQRSDFITTWLGSHPLISRNMLCQMTGYDVTSLHKAITGDRSIPAKHIDAIENVLKNYGYPATEESVNVPL